MQFEMPQRLKQRLAIRAIPSLATTTTPVRFVVPDTSRREYIRGVQNGVKALKMNRDIRQLNG
jgi:hypothetical protein